MWIKSMCQLKKNASSCCRKQTSANEGLVMWYTEMGRRGNDKEDSNERLVVRGCSLLKGNEPG